MTRWTAKFRAHCFPEGFPIFQHHCQRSICMCSLLFPIGHHPCPCAWTVWPQLFHFDPFLLSMELSHLLDLAISRDLLEPTLLLFLPLPLPRPLLPLEEAKASSSSPPLSPSSFSFHFVFALSAAAWPFYILPLSSDMDLSLNLVSLIIKFLIWTFTLWAFILGILFTSPIKSHIQVLV